MKLDDGAREHGRILLGNTNRKEIVGEMKNQPVGAGGERIPLKERPVRPSVIAGGHDNRPSRTIRPGQGDAHTGSRQAPGHIQNMHRQLCHLCPPDFGAPPLYVAYDQGLATSGTCRCCWGSSWQNRTGTMPRKPSPSGARVSAGKHAAK